MPDRTLIASAVLSIFALGASMAGAAPGAGRPGQVGGPPTVRLGKPDEGRRTTPELVIGRGQQFDGSVELVAYGWTEDEFDEPPQRGMCIWAEYASQEAPDFETCLTDGEARTGAAVEIDSGGGLVRPRRLSWTTIGGRLSPEVAAVRVSFHRAGSQKRFHAKATVAHVDGELQRKLRQAEAVGYFTVRVRGIVAARSFRVQAVDHDGRVIGTFSTVGRSGIRSRQ